MKIKDSIRAGQLKCPDCNHRMRFHNTVVMYDGVRAFLGCRATKRGKFCRCARASAK